MAFFSFSSWLKNMRTSLLGTRRNKRRSAVRPIRSTRLNLEQLEDRLTPSTLATHALIEAPTVGIAADAVTATGAWTAVANASWLHPTAGNSSGTGNGTAIFTLDANTGATRVGTLTIAGETLTVTQAGGTYVAAYPVTFPVGGSSVKSAIAVDAAGNVYFPDSSGNIDELSAATQTVGTLITGLPIGTGVTHLAVDTAGDVYIDGQVGNAGTIYEWNATTHAISTVVPTGIAADYQLDGLAVDTAGNIYTSSFAGNGHPGLFEVNAAYPNGLSLLSSLPTNYIGPTYGPGTPNPTGNFNTYGVAVDGTGNVYFNTGNFGANVTGEYNPSTQTISWFAPMGGGPMVADGAGNLYVAPVGYNGNGGILYWNAATQTRITATSGTPFSNGTFGVGLDASGNIYAATYNDGLVMIPVTFVPTGPVSETAAAGSDSLLPVLDTELLLGQFAPTSNQTWLTITGVTGDVVSYSFTQNTTGAPRTANISVLGKTIAVTQSATVPNSPPVIAVDAPAAVTVNEGSLATKTGTWSDANLGDTVTLSATIGGVPVGTVTKSGTNAAGTWSWSYTPTEEAAAQTVTITANDGTASTQTTFWLTITDAPLTAGALTPPIGTGPLTYSATLAGLANPDALAFDSSGNLYVVNYDNGTVSKFAPGAATASATLTGVSGPFALVFDASGNLFVANRNPNAASNGTTISKFAAASLAALTSGSLAPTASLTGLTNPYDMAFDSSGNLFVANFGTTPHTGTVSEFAPGATTPSATHTGVDNPPALAVDGHGHLFVVNAGNNTVSEYAPGATTPTATLTGLNYPNALAFDGSGNLYVANYGGTTVSKFAPGALSPTATLTGLSAPYNLTVDASGNLYVANVAGGNNTVSIFTASALTGTGTIAAISTLSGNGLTRPNALAFDGSGNLYVANFGVTTVTKFAPQPIAEGQAFTNKTVFHFTDADPNGTASDYTATVTLNGSTIATLTSTATSSGQIVANAGGGFDVQLSYAFPEELPNATLSVTVTDHNAQVSASTSTFNVADAPLTAGTITTTTQGVENVTNAAISVTLTDAAGAYSLPTDFTTGGGSVTIDWNTGAAGANGSPAADASLSVTDVAGAATITGSHNYTAPGAYYIHIHVVDDGGNVTDIYGSTTVAIIAEPGYYAPVGSAVEYEDPAGTWSAAGATSATTDPAGTFSAAGAASPTTDVAGTYSAAGAASATPASPGYYVATAGASSETAASPGSYVPTSGATSATPADPGYYVPGSAATSEIEDPAGKFSAAGATAATTDSAGTYSAAGAAAATPASPGYYVATTGASSEIPAAPGSYVPTSGASSATLASPGYYVPGSAATSEIQDPAGTFSGAGATAPTTDPAGTYSAAGAASATTDSAGTYSAAGATSPTTDPAGTYSGSGAAAPTQDPAGTYSGSGATTATQDPAGTYSGPGAASATQDPAGTFSGPGAASATTDPAGTYSAAGAASATTDPAGTYSPAGAASATTDPAGTYSAAGAASATTDPAGTYSGAGAATPTTDPAGTFSGPGAASATIDPAGTYSGPGASSATTDPAGTFSGPGAASATTDPAGTYSGPGAAAPTPAPAGTYIPTTGATSASAAITDPAGTYSTPGAAAPTTDPAGTYSSPGAAAPTTDPAGTYSAPGAAAPTTDPAGTYSGPGAGAPTPFPGGALGTVTPTAGAPFSGTVASFTNTVTGATPASYSARITWGDGSTSVGTITDNGGGTFLVSGSHTYAVAGTDAVTVTITQIIGNTTTAIANSSAVVTNLGFGQTQDLDYWHKSAGQALINSFNGGSTATVLSTWLATTYPNLYGAQAGSNNLTGKTNAQVAAFFQSLWNGHHVTADVQTLTTALNVYASTLSLGGAAGEAAGFQVTNQGLGGSSYNVGNNGAAFRVANNTTLTVSQLLAAVNNQAVGGVLYSSNPSRRDPATDTLDKVNREGKVGIQDDQVQPVSFWHRDRGQDLITAFNGGPNSTALSSWLATTFPAMYGSGAGANNLTGMTNTQAAAFFQSLWANHHDEADVQVLALALNVYATTQALGGAAGQAAGFTVTAAGLGAASFNIGNAGAAAAVANNTTLNVYDLLVAVNHQAVNGVLYNGNAQLRDLCEDLCEDLNQAGQ